MARTGSRCPGVIMTMISSTSGLLLSTSIVCSMIGRPAILMSCLGMLSPTRLPTPPARTTATVRNAVTRQTLPAVARAAVSPARCVEQREHGPGERLVALGPDVVAAHRHPLLAQRVVAEHAGQHCRQLRQVRCDEVCR